jgi:hypothetical protein
MTTTRDSGGSPTSDVENFQTQHLPPPGRGGAGHRGLHQPPGADVPKTAYLKDANESRIYFALVRGLVVIGCLVLLSGMDQPLVMLVISAVTGGVMMFIYSALLLLVNRRVLPEQMRPGAMRVGALVWSFLLFGFLSMLTFNDQIPKLFGGE